MSVLQILVHKKRPLHELFAAPLSSEGELIDLEAGHDPGKFDLLVLDAYSIHPFEFAESARYAKQALDADKPVLVLRPSSSHKVVLADAGALGTYPTGESTALLIEPWRDAQGKLRLALAEQYPPSAGRSHLVRTIARNGGNDAQNVVDEFEAVLPQLPTPDEMTRFVDRVRKSVTRLREGAPLGDLSPNLPPPVVPSGLYSVTPINLYYPQTITALPALGYQPPNGSVGLEGLVTVGIYYDNTSFSTPVQWLFIESSGSFYTLGMEEESNTAIGWSVGEIQIAGQSISSSTLVSNSSSPNNANNETSYSFEESIGVGLAAGTDGLESATSYSISTSQTVALTDWQIAQSAPNSWVFSQAVPYNGATPPGNIPTGAASSNGVAQLGLISTNGVIFDAATSWVQNPANNTNSTVNYTYYTQAFFTYLSNPGKNAQGAYWIYPSSYPQTLNLDWASAWPSS